MEWKDYDGSTIDVYDNLADDGTPIGRPKTPASVARVPVPEFAADFLAKWRVQQARIFDADGDTPICSWDGSFIKPEAMSVWWQRESAKWECRTRCTSCGIPSSRFWLALASIRARCRSSRGRRRSR